MFSATWVTSSSSKQYLTSGLIASRTFASGPLPSATPRIAMSRSVIIPTSLSFSVTGNRPASIFFIKAAALRIVSSGLISCTSLLMTLLIFIACPPLFIYPHHITLGPGILFMTLQVDEVSAGLVSRFPIPTPSIRSEEHTSELQSQSNLVCRLLLDKKKDSVSITTLTLRSIDSYHIRNTPIIAARRSIYSLLLHPIVVERPRTS